MSETIQTPPKSGAKLFVGGPDVLRGKARCVLCDRQIEDKAIAFASHARKHVREGTAEEHGRDGSHYWTVK